MVEQEVAVLRRLAVRQEREAEVFVRERVEELEVARLLPGLRLERDARVALVAARDRRPRGSASRCCGRVRAPRSRRGPRPCRRSPRRCAPCRAGSGKRPCPPRPARPACRSAQASCPSAAGSGRCSPETGRGPRIPAGRGRAGGARSRRRCAAPPRARAPRRRGGGRRPRWRTRRPRPSRGWGRSRCLRASASVSLRKTCSTCVVATCPAIFVSILTDLTGSARGKGTGRGGTGQRRHGPGTITPCALAVAAPASARSRTPKTRHSKSLTVRIIRSLTEAFFPSSFSKRGDAPLRSDCRTPPALFLAARRGGRGLWNKSRVRVSKRIDTTDREEATVRRPSRHDLRKHWLSLCATVLVLYTVFPIRLEDLYDLGALTARLELVMFLLSFPLGSLFMYVFYTGIGRHRRTHPALDDGARPRLRPVVPPRPRAPRAPPPRPDHFEPLPRRHGCLRPRRTPLRPARAPQSNSTPPPRPPSRNSTPAASRPSKE